MDKLEFTHFYKFIVSVSFLLIAFGVIGPFLLVKDSIDKPAIIEKSKESNEIIELKDSYIKFYLKAAPWFSAISILFGGIFATIGLINWYKRQLIIDKNENLEVEKKSRDLESMTIPQITKRAIQEIIEENTQSVSNKSSENSLDKEINSYFEAEELFKTILKTLIPDNFQIYFNKMLRATPKALQYDAIIEKLKDSGPEKAIVLELKYSNRGYSETIIKNSLEFLDKLCISYASWRNIPTAGVLIILSSEKILSKKNVSRYQHMLANTAKYAKLNHTMYTVSVEELKSNPNEVINKLLDLFGNVV